MNIIERFRLDGKKALVTGAGRGLGKAFCLALAEAGANVAVIDLNPETAAETAEEVKKVGKDSFSLGLDVSDPETPEIMIANIKEKWGTLDIAVNNVGVAVPIDDSINMTSKEWDKVFNINLRGTFFCAQEEAKAMLPNKYGKIINIASICAHIVWPEWQTFYSVSKAGVAHMTRCLAAEWIKHGIRVNAISPGVTRTPELFQEVIPVFLERAPIDRIGEVEDLQGALIYLASEVSDFMVGQELILDGGYTIM